MFEHKFELSLNDVKEYEQLKTALFISRTNFKIKGKYEDYLLARNEDASEVTLQVSQGMLKSVLEVLCLQASMGTITTQIDGGL